jgi:unspecific monooxygenase
VQDPYPFYDRVREAGPFAYWSDYNMAVSARASIVGGALRDRRLGRETPAELARPTPPHLEPFYALERHSMLELEAPRHTRLRRLVVRAFTSGRIAALAPDITALCHRLIDDMPDGGGDLLKHFAKPLPVIVIARLLGVPETDAPDLLAWSNAMVQMYQARRNDVLEAEATQAAQAFTDYLSALIETRRKAPGDDLLSGLIAVQEDGTHLSRDELIATVVLLLNAGHEATVHTIGNGVKTLLEKRDAPLLGEDRVDGTLEEILRFDPPLHLFTRWAYEDVSFQGEVIKAGTQIGLLLAGANRDPDTWDRPNAFNPTRPVKTNFSFGAGTHFCIGAPLARLEMRIALPILFARLPAMRLAQPPLYGDLYHFHGLEALNLSY